MDDLSASYTALNRSSRLVVLREAPLAALARVCKVWGVDVLVFEGDTDAYGKARDEEVKKAVEALGVKVVVVRGGRTLWDCEAVVKANGGRPTMSITQLQAAGAKVGDVPKPLPKPDWVPGTGHLKTEDLCAAGQDLPNQQPDLNVLHRDFEEKSYSAGIAGPKKDFAPPTMEELGLKEATSPHRGGETRALQMLDKIIDNEDFTATFSKPMTAPTAFEPQSTCLTSPHIHFGSLSVRLFYHRVQKVLKRYKGSATEPPTSLLGQLLFRDMYFAAHHALGWKFAQTAGNEHCRFIPWHLPSKVDASTGLITGEYEIDDPEKEEWFQRWRNGRTGFPWIDALMRQLRQEGWIHHLGRHAVACFLTRGGCYISWERGAEVFEELLIDHETACNVGNWQWLSCTAFFSQFYRCYSPIAFPQKWDKEGAFVKRYVPELKDLPPKYIYEPWKAPIQDQRKAGVRITGNGLDDADDGGLKVYPKPMFDFSERREVCIQSMKKAYNVGLQGNHPKVLNGTWKNLFPDNGEGPSEGKKGGPVGTIDTKLVSGLEKKQYEVHNTRGKPGTKIETNSSSRTTRICKRDRTQETLEAAFKKMKKGHVSEKS